MRFVTAELREGKGAHLDLYRAQALDNVLGGGVSPGRGCSGGGILLLFDFEGGTGFGEVVCLEVAEEGEDFVV